ncbi:methionine ABC transporter substrate-binding protein [Helicobacter winghamensis]|uniref:MetQ/NlpA family ABC transporter substrate-binding protein n=1 Tax=Helicobacter winghamensis TaxID=157268 RepID=UPI000C6DAC7C|nr:MetQ/NlpA family ABC transporter substrate-binding protein [Helicobacter winghamensis]PKT76653.1 methionine ABC transporter substrate-binding protein [Helicobacter winghamensis]PKT76772.1 methionine ABC transporter substrate-binding protein [Helicobacter winghamensis]
MFKFALFSKLTFAALLVAAIFSGCDSKTESNMESKTSANSQGTEKIIVGATPEPHAMILEQIKPLLAKDGIEIEIKEFTDYVTPNKSLDDGSLDANFFQHKPYLDSFNKEHKTNLVSVAGIHIEPMGIYSKNIKNLDELKEGDLISLPNDPSNGARALRILEKNGLIKLKDGVELASVQDIVENSKGLKFKEMDAPQLARALGDVSASVINTNFALLAGLNPLNDAIAIEDKDSPYANILVVKAGNENNPNIQKLISALQSEEVRKFIMDTYKGAILPSF